LLLLAGAFGSLAILVGIVIVAIFLGARRRLTHGAWSLLHLEVVDAVARDSLALLGNRSRLSIRFVRLAFTTQVGYVVHVHLVEEGGVLPVLRLVVKVDVEAFHLLLELLLLLGFFLSQLPFFLFLLLLSLHLSKLLENILVVKDGVGELVFEVVFVQQLSNSGPDEV